MDFSLIEKADLSHQDFADMVGISRISLTKIITNGNYQRIARALTILEKLIAAGKLPRGYARTDRASRDALVAKLKEKLDEAPVQCANV